LDGFKIPNAPKKLITCWAKERKFRKPQIILNQTKLRGKNQLKRKNP
jgi:hypothetical protein